MDHYCYRYLYCPSHIVTVFYVHVPCVTMYLEGISFVFQNSSCKLSDYLIIFDFSISFQVLCVSNFLGDISIGLVLKGLATKIESNGDWSRLSFSRLMLLRPNVAKLNHTE